MNGVPRLRGDDEVRASDYRGSRNENSRDEFGL